MDWLHERAWLGVPGGVQNQAKTQLGILRDRHGKRQAHSNPGLLDGMLRNTKEKRWPRIEHWSVRQRNVISRKRGLAFNGGPQRGTGYTVSRYFSGCNVNWSRLDSTIVDRSSNAGDEQTTIRAQEGEKEQ